jgi:hypothetical protein
MIHKEGLFLDAPNPIVKDTLIAIFSGARHAKHPNHATEYTIQLGVAYIEPTSAARYVNHCCRPNAKFQKWCDKEGNNKQVGIVATTCIMPGEEITVTYNNPNQFGGACRCGGFACRKDMTPYNNFVEAVANAPPVQKSVLTLAMLSRLRQNLNCTEIPIWCVKDSQYYMGTPPNELFCLAYLRRKQMTGCSYNTSKKCWWVVVEPLKPEVKRFSRMKDSF